MLKEVTVKKIEDCPNPKFSKVQLVTAERDGKEFPWEISPGADTVHIAVFNTDTEKFLLVKQVRVPVLINDPATKGIVVECCAGLVDKDKPVEQIAIEEVEEELGYRVQPDNIFEFYTIKQSVGKSGITSHLFMAEVSNADKVSDGGGTDSEDIEIVEVQDVEIMKYLLSVTTDATTMALSVLASNIQMAKSLEMAKEMLQ